MIFTYRVERIERSFATVEIEVSEYELGLHPSEVEQRAIAELYLRETVEWTTESTHRAIQIRRRVE